MMVRFIFFGKFHIGRDVFSWDSVHRTGLSYRQKQRAFFTAHTRDPLFMAIYFVVLSERLIESITGVPFLRICQAVVTIHSTTVHASGLRARLSVFHSTAVIPRGVSRVQACHGRPRSRLRLSGVIYPTRREGGAAVGGGSSRCWGPYHSFGFFWCKTAHAPTFLRGLNAYSEQQ